MFKGVRDSIRSVSPILTLLALAVGYSLGMSFFTIELERLVERTLTPAIRESAGVAAIGQEVQSSPYGFVRSHRVQLIGGACLALILVLALVGLLVQKGGLPVLGSGALFLTTYAHFVIHMSFLAGLRVLTAVWRPFWGSWVKLGDVVYVPYMILVYPLSLLGVDARMDVAYLPFRLGLVLFCLGTVAWFYARFRRQGTADFWVYRFSRHPQYLGWIVWSYGLLLRGAQSDLPFGQPNVGASLPWLISTMILVCVALGEEIKMSRRYGHEYDAYRERTPFLFPLPRGISRAISAPLRFLLGKERPESGRELVLVFVLYSALLALLSLPFALLNWPRGGWGAWPAL